MRLFILTICQMETARRKCTARLKEPAVQALAVKCDWKMIISSSV